MAKFLGILVLIAIALGAWYYFATPDFSPGPVSTTTTSGSSVSYASSTLGFAFRYPSTYTLQENSATSTAGDGVHLTLADTEALQQAPQGGEGPPSISIGVYSTNATSAAEWIRTDQRSNFQLAATSSLRSLTIDGTQAQEYETDGLYATRNVVLIHEGRVFMFSVGWISREDQIVDDFAQLLQTVDLQ